MTLVEIIDDILFRSGQFIVGEIEASLINRNMFWAMTKRVLAYYEKHKPISSDLLIDITTDAYTFSSDIPWFISNISYNAANTDYYDHPIFARQRTTFVDRSYWRYNAPTLYTTLRGQFIITANYKYEYTETFDSGNLANIINVDIPCIDVSHDKFLDLVLADFLIGLGRSRRAFTLNDLPVLNDGSELASEGKELKESTKESLGIMNKWYNVI